MTEQINKIIELYDSRNFCLQSLYNDANAEGEPVPGNSYYVGYFCVGAEDATPLPGEQPGQVYPEAGGLASLERAPMLIDPPF